MSRILLGLALGLALGYIVRLRRELVQARQRGDMYRDIAASLDRAAAPPQPSLSA